jgi:hypothetical protein
MALQPIALNCQQINYEQRQGVGGWNQHLVLLHRGPVPGGQAAMSRARADIGWAGGGIKGQRSAAESGNLGS